MFRTQLELETFIYIFPAPATGAAPGVDIDPTVLSIYSIVLVITKMLPVSSMLN